MKRHKLLLCVLVILAAVLAGCGGEAAPGEATVPETEVPAESFLALAQGFVDKEDYASAMAVLEEAPEDPRVEAMREEITRLLPVELQLLWPGEEAPASGTDSGPMEYEVGYLFYDPRKKNAVQIHSFRVKEGEDVLPSPWTLPPSRGSSCSMSCLAVYLSGTRESARAVTRPLPLPSPALL